MIFASTLFASAAPFLVISRKPIVSHPKFPDGIFLVLHLKNLPLPVMEGRAESALNRHGCLSEQEIAFVYTVQRGKF
jgi:hypothetical protein